MRDGMSYFKEVKINDDQLGKILQKMYYKFIPSGKDVFRYGDTGEQFYIIISGRVSVNIPKNNKAQNDISHSISTRKDDHFTDG